MKDLAWELKAYPEKQGSPESATQITSLCEQPLDSSNNRDHFFKLYYTHTEFPNIHVALHLCIVCVCARCIGVGAVLLPFILSPSVYYGVDIDPHLHTIQWHNLNIVFLWFCSNEIRTVYFWKMHFFVMLTYSCVILYNLHSTHYSTAKWADLNNTDL